MSITFCNNLNHQILSYLPLNAFTYEHWQDANLSSVLILQDLGAMLRKVESNTLLGRAVAAVSVDDTKVAITALILFSNLEGVEEISLTDFDRISTKILHSSPFIHRTLCKAATIGDLALFNMALATNILSQEATDEALILAVENKSFPIVAKSVDETVLNVRNEDEILGKNPDGMSLWHYFLCRRTKNQVGARCSIVAIHHALKLAAKSGNLEMVNKFIESKLCNRSLHEAFQIALENKHFEVAKILALSPENLPNSDKILPKLLELAVELNQEDFISAHPVLSRHLARRA